MEGGGERFLTTHWSLVEAAGAADGERAREALAELCQAYWYPLYAFVRRCDVSAVDAEDVVQSFFARLLETRDLSRVVRGEGRFRSFLRVAVRNHLSNLRDRERAQKRGGGRVRLAIDFEGAAERFAGEVTTEESPERAFDRLWALGLIERALAQVGSDYAASGRGAVFESLSPFVQGDPDAADHARAAAELGLAEGAVRVAVHRLRKRFREAVRGLIAETVAREEEVDAELEELFRALAG